MGLWDQDDVELLGRAMIDLDEDGTGTMRFIAVVASLDHRAGERAGVPAVEFSWSGWDDRSPAAGRGWIATAKRDQAMGHVFLHGSVDSAFTAVRDVANPRLPDTSTGSHETSPSR
jgi:hypothetical protein